MDADRAKFDFLTTGKRNNVIFFWEVRRVDLLQIFALASVAEDIHRMRLE